jgi:hypothetical protein
MSTVLDNPAVAKSELHELVTRMFVYTDRRRWEDLSRVFADEVTLDWTALFGGEPATVHPIWSTGNRDLLRRAASS